MESADSHQDMFFQQLIEKHSKETVKTLMTKQEYFSLIEELKNASKESAKKSKRQYYILTRYVENDGK